MEPKRADERTKTCKVCWVSRPVFDGSACPTCVELFETNVDEHFHQPRGLKCSAPNETACLMHPCVPCKLAKYMDVTKHKRIINLCIFCAGYTVLKECTCSRCRKDPSRKMWPAVNQPPYIFTLERPLVRVNLGGFPHHQLNRVKRQLRAECSVAMERLSEPVVRQLQAKSRDPLVSGGGSAPENQPAKKKQGQPGREASVPDKSSNVERPPASPSPVDAPIGSKVSSSSLQDVDLFDSAQVSLSGKSSQKPLDQLPEKKRRSKTESKFSASASSSGTKSRKDSFTSREYEELKKTNSEQAKTIADQKKQIKELENTIEELKRNNSELRRVIKSRSSQCAPSSSRRNSDLASDASNSLAAEGEPSGDTRVRSTPSPLSLLSRTDLPRQKKRIRLYSSSSSDETTPQDADSACHPSKGAALVTSDDNTENCSPSPPNESSSSQKQSKGESIPKKDHDKKRLDDEKTNEKKTKGLPIDLIAKENSLKKRFTDKAESPLPQETASKFRIPKRKTPITTNPVPESVGLPPLLQQNLDALSKVPSDETFKAPSSMAPNAPKAAADHPQTNARPKELNNNTPSATDGLRSIINIVPPRRDGAAKAVAFARQLTLVRNISPLSSPFCGNADNSGSSSENDHSEPSSAFQLNSVAPEDSSGREQQHPVRQVAGQWSPISYKTTVPFPDQVSVSHLPPPPIDFIKSDLHYVPQMSSRPMAPGVRPFRPPKRRIEDTVENQAPSHLTPSLRRRFGGDSSSPSDSDSSDESESTTSSVSTEERRVMSDTDESALQPAGYPEYCKRLFNRPLSVNRSPLEEGACSEPSENGESEKENGSGKGRALISQEQEEGTGAPGPYPIGRELDGDDAVDASSTDILSPPEHDSTTLSPVRQSNASQKKTLLSEPEGEGDEEDDDVLEMCIGDGDIVEEDFTENESGSLAPSNPSSSTRNDPSSETSKRTSTRTGPFSVSAVSVSAQGSDPSASHRETAILRPQSSRALPLTSQHRSEGPSHDQDVCINYLRSGSCDSRQCRNVHDGSIDVIIGSIKNMIEENRCSQAKALVLSMTHRQSQFQLLLANPSQPGRQIIETLVSACLEGGNKEKEHALYILGNSKFQLLPQLCENAIKVSPNTANAANLLVKLYQRLVTGGVTLSTDAWNKIINLLPQHNEWIGTLGAVRGAVKQHLNYEATFEAINFLLDGSLSEKSKLEQVCEMLQGMRQRTIGMLDVRRRHHVLQALAHHGMWDFHRKYADLFGIDVGNSSRQGVDFGMRGPIMPHAQMQGPANFPPNFFHHPNLPMWGFGHPSGFYNVHGHVYDGSGPGMMRGQPTIAGIRQSSDRSGNVFDPKGHFAQPPFPSFNRFPVHDSMSHREAVYADSSLQPPAPMPAVQPRPPPPCVVRPQVPQPPVHHGAPPGNPKAKRARTELDWDVVGPVLATPKRPAPPHAPPPSAQQSAQLPRMRTDEPGAGEKPTADAEASATSTERSSALVIAVPEPTQPLDRNLFQPKAPGCKSEEIATFDAASSSSLSSSSSSSPSCSSFPTGLGKLGERETQPIPNNAEKMLISAFDAGNFQEVARILMEKYSGSRNCRLLLKLVELLKAYVLENDAKNVGEAAMKIVNETITLAGEEGMPSLKPLLVDLSYWVLQTSSHLYKGSWLLDEDVYSVHQAGGRNYLNFLRIIAINSNLDLLEFVREDLRLALFCANCMLCVGDEEDGDEEEEKGEGNVNGKREAKYWEDVCDAVIVALDLLKEFHIAARSHATVGKELVKIELNILNAANRLSEELKEQSSEFYSACLEALTEYQDAALKNKKRFELIVSQDGDIDS